MPHRPDEGSAYVGWRARWSPCVGRVARAVLQSLTSQQLMGNGHHQGCSYSLPPGVAALHGWQLEPWGPDPQPRYLPIAEGARVTLLWRGKDELSWALLLTCQKWLC